ncbi:hypothetical protein GCM10010171_24600 [Actinokineospora fastidiosa]|uniref:Uncharacterized protein n=1 Tax=Actinokineospora fastidiosa TaxID=1816 RepID=A0A918LCJ1_9PSEU|nr:hypothetical protein GCM10010171_24600 [Actinokineospora fastidiosa]
MAGAVAYRFRPRGIVRRTAVKGPHGRRSRLQKRGAKAAFAAFALAMQGRIDAGGRNVQWRISMG